MAWGGTSISECRVPPPYLSLFYQSTSSVLAINEEVLHQKRGSTASKLPDTPASLTLTLTLTSAITSHMVSSVLSSSPLVHILVVVLSKHPFVVFGSYYEVWGNL